MIIADSLITIAKANAASTNDRSFNIPTGTFLDVMNSKTRQIAVARIAVGLNPNRLCSTAPILLIAHCVRLASTIIRPPNTTERKVSNLISFHLLEVIE
jgi:hypothetical protein